MILKSLKMNNIRSYVDESVNFPQGSVLLSGDIGSGKSTILLATEFALFGILRPNLSGESLLRNGQKEGSVELRFTLNSKEVLIKRSLKRTGDSVKQEAGYILIDGIKQDATAVELKTAILDLLGYPRELVTKSKSLVYRYTVYTPQEEMKQILFDDRESRLDTLRKVFGIDKYKKVNENASIVLRSIKERIKERSGMIFDLEEKKNQLEQSKRELHVTFQNLSLVSPRVGVLKATVKEILISLERSQEQMNQFVRIQNELNVHYARFQEKNLLQEKNIRELEFEQAQQRATKEKIDSLAVPLDISLEQLETTINELDFSINKTAQETSALSERIKANSVLRNSLRQELDYKTSQSNTLRVKINEISALQEQMKQSSGLAERQIILEQEIRDFDLALKEHEVNKKRSTELKEKISSMTNCPLCLQEVNIQHKDKITSTEIFKISEESRHMHLLGVQKQEKEAALAGIKGEIQKFSELERKITALHHDVKSVDQLSKEISEKQIQYKTVDLHINKDAILLNNLAQKDIIAMSHKLDQDKVLFRKLQDKIYFAETLRQRFDRIAALHALQENLSKEMNTIQGSMSELKARTELLKNAEEECSRTKACYESAREEEKKTELEEAQLKKEYEGIARIVESIKVDIDKKTAFKEEIVRLQQLQNWLDSQFLNITALMEKHVMMAVYGEFNELFKKWANLLIDDEAFSLRLDHEFTPIVEQNGYETELINLSGGEKTAVAMAYRLALNKVINDVISSIRTKDLIILDEPTDGFSSEQLDKVREVIDELGITQTIIVSHENKMESFVQNVIRVQKQGHESKVLG